MKLHVNININYQNYLLVDYLTMWLTALWSLSFRIRPNKFLALLFSIDPYEIGLDEAISNTINNMIAMMRMDFILFFLFSKEIILYF